MRVFGTISSRKLGVTALLSILLSLGTVASFRLESYFFQRKVNSVLERMESIQLDKTSEAEVLSLLPELRSGTTWSFGLHDSSLNRCPGDACYVLETANWPHGMLAELRQKFGHRGDGVFKAVYWLGHRFRDFGVYVEIRSGRVSRYNYALSVEDGDYPAEDVLWVSVLGTDRASFPRGAFGFIQTYDGIEGLRITEPSNKRTKDINVAFTPDAQLQEVKNALDIHLKCIWNAAGCRTTSQLLPGIYGRERKSETCP